MLNLTLNLRVSTCFSASMLRTTQHATVAGRMHNRGDQVYQYAMAHICTEELPHIAVYE